MICRYVALSQDTSEYQQPLLNTSVNLAQAERHALRQDVAQARTQLHEAQASSCSAEAAANISQEEKAAMAQALSAAR